MSCLYFVITVLVLIIIPPTVNSFFLYDIKNISIARNITCQLNDTTTSAGNFQLCVIRVYNGLINSSEVSVTVYNGLRYVNSFFPYINSSCSFQNSVNASVTGSGSCAPRRSFENFESMQICICATNNCNQNITSCRDSVSKNPNVTAPTAVLPDLHSLVQCNYALNIFVTCTEHKFINISLCEEYVKNQSVLCAVTINGTQITQTALIRDDYQRFLTEKIYQFKSSSNNALGSSFNETDTNFYQKYFLNTSQSVEECSCTTSNSCNYNISTCLSQTQTTTTTTTTTTAPTTTSTTTSTATTTTARTTTSTTTSTATTTTAPTTTSTTTSTATTTTAPTTTSTTTSTATTTTAPTTTSTTTSTATTTTAPTTTSTTTSTATTTTARTTTTTTTTTASTSSVNQQSAATGEKGLGRQATAGIVCGIIFSALLFIAEIVFFKFFYPRIAGGGAERSVAYQA